MYICICNGVSDKDIRRAAKAGARTTEQAYASMGIEISCAKCIDLAQDIIDTETQSFAETG